MDPYGDHAVTCKHGPHTIRRHDRMLYVENIIANEAGLKSRLEKTSLIVDRKDHPVDVLLLMFCIGQDAYLDSVITHPLQLTFIGPSGRKESGRCQGCCRQGTLRDDDEKCRRNGMRFIAMAWETFVGSTPEMRIMIRKIAIHHVDNHNRPEDRPSTSSINVFLSCSSKSLGRS
jgi:hypothetical protein